MIPLLPLVFLLVQAAISVDTELVAVPVTATDAHGHVESTAVVRPSDVQVIQPPSPDLTVYFEGELVRVSIPSNWRELPGSNAVTFAPEGAYGNVGVKSVFTHGLAMGLARNDKRNLRITTDDFIESYLVADPSPRRAFRYRAVTIGDRPGLHAVVATVSEATGEPERIEIFTTLLRDGTLFYVLAIVPRDRVSDYEGTFRRVLESIEIVDCDRRALENRQVNAGTIPLCSENTRSVNR